MFVWYKLSLCIPGTLFRPGQPQTQGYLIASDFWFLIPKECTTTLVSFCTFKVLGVLLGWFWFYPHKTGIFCILVVIRELLKSGAWTLLLWGWWMCACALYESSSCVKIWRQLAGIGSFPPYGSWELNSSHHHTSYQVSLTSLYSLSLGHGIV